MARYYQLFKTLITATTLSGVYLSSFEKIYGRKWYVKFLKVLFVAPASLQLLYFLASVKFLLFDEEEGGSKIYAVTITVYSFFTAFTVYSFYLSRNEFERLFELWESMFREDPFGEEREVTSAGRVLLLGAAGADGNYVQEWLRRAREGAERWLRVFGALSVLSPVLYCGATYFSPEKELEHPTGIPYRRQSPDFELMNTFDLVSSVFGFAVLVTYDSMTMVFLSLEEAQLLHLKTSLARIIELVPEPDNGKANRSNSNGLAKRRAFDDAEGKVRVWISHHVQVLSFHEELQNIYRFPLSVKYMVFVLIICLCTFLAITGTFSSKVTLMAIAFCFNYYALFYVNVRLADSIAEVAATIFGDAFAQNWPLCPPNLKRAFHIILMRTNRPLHYVALRIYPLSSTTFLAILYSAYSFFMFLLHLNRKRGDSTPE